MLSNIFDIYYIFVYITIVRLKFLKTKYLFIFIIKLLTVHIIIYNFLISLIVTEIREGVGIRRGR